jgi:hypothetical protein
MEDLDLWPHAIRLTRKSRFDEKAVLMENPFITSTTCACEIILLHIPSVGRATHHKLLAPTLSTNIHLSSNSVDLDRFLSSFVFCGVLLTKWVHLYHQIYYICNIDKRKLGGHVLARYQHVNLINNYM